MEVNIIPIGNSFGVILPKALMEKFNLKCRDTLIVSPSADKFTLEAKKKSSFFSELPVCLDAYGGDTEKYLERMEEPEDE